MSSKDIEKLYQTGKTEKSPDSVDKSILSHAKASCRNPVSKTSRHWFYSLSTAAVLVLSFSIILNLQNETAKMQSDVALPELEEPVDRKNDSMPLRTETNRNDSGSQTNDEDYPQPDKELMKSGPAPSVSIPDEAIELEEIVEEKPVKQVNSKREKDVSNTVIINEPEDRTITDKNPAESSGSLSADSETDDYIDYSDPIQPPGKPKTNAVGVSKSKKITNVERNSYLSDQLLELNHLLQQKKMEQARELLRTLKIKYPDYDFTEIEKQMNTVSSDTN